MAKDCPFCNMDPSRIIRKTKLVYTIGDGYPVSPGHTLVIPTRHAGSFFETTAEEKSALFEALNVAKEDLDTSLHPDGYNVGINDGEAAGQTIAHLHVHLIPRFSGDQPDPRGGIRWIFPDKADYWSRK